jgi:glycosyltransferase involved in cell wall biosynthesis
MRVLEVTEAAASGVLRVVEVLADGLAAHGHDVAVGFGRRPETPPDLEAGLPAGVHVTALPWASRTVTAQVTAASALRGLVRTWRPDVVHLHSSFAGAVGAAAVAGSVPAVYTPHGFAFARAGEGRLLGAAYRAVDSAVARRCALVGAVSEAEAQLARARLRAPRVAIVPNGIPELDPASLPEPAARREPVVVAMGRIDAQRRPDEAACILRSVRDLAAVCWIGAAARGEDAPLVAAGVPVTGWVPHRVACEQLGRATVCLHWSASDGQSLAVLEALARDVVVVASDIPPNRELLGDRQVAADVAAGLALIRAVLTDRGLREQMLAAQRERRGRWSASAMVAGWMDVYERLVAESRAPPRRGRHRGWRSV